MTSRRLIISAVSHRLRLTKILDRQTQMTKTRTVVDFREKRHDVCTLHGNCTDPHRVIEWGCHGLEGLCLRQRLLCSRCVYWLLGHQRLHISKGLASIRSQVALGLLSRVGPPPHEKSLIEAVSSLPVRRRSFPMP